MFLLNFIIILFSFIILNGCASKLIVCNADLNEPKGIRARLPVTCLITTEYTIEKISSQATTSAANVPPGVKPKETDQTRTTKKETRTMTTQRIEDLPLGKEFDINFFSAPLAKSEFTIEVNTNGTLKTVTLNSTPQVSETITALASLLKEAAVAAKEIKPTEISIGEGEKITKERINLIKDLKNGQTLYEDRVIKK